MIEFLNIVDEVYGIYIDSDMGYHNNLETFAKAQQFNLDANHGMTMEQLDQIPITFGKGAIGEPGSYILHECTQGDFKKRNADGGKHHDLAGNMIITVIYNYWEDHYRPQLTKISGTGLKSDVFGDLGFLRNDIIHHRSIATDRTLKCKIFNWFKPGDRIAFSKDQVEMIIWAVKNEIEKIKSK